MENEQSSSHDMAVAPEQSEQETLVLGQEGEDPKGHYIVKEMPGGKLVKFYGADESDKYWPH
jgi:hypothetical protein